MRRSGFFGRLTGLGVLMVVTMPTGAAAATPEECERIWREESAKYANGPEMPDVQGMLARWRVLAPRCGSTGAYHARLAGIHAMLGQQDEHRAELDVARAKGDSPALVELASIQPEYFRAFQGNPSDQELAQLEQHLAEFTARRPAMQEGFAQLGAVQAARGRHREAIGTLQHALGPTINQGGVYLGLVLSYTAIGDWTNAEKTADQAMQVVPNMWQSAEFCYALLRVYAATGDFKAVKDVLTVLQATHPEAPRDPEFQDAIAFVREKRSAQGQVAPTPALAK